ncbi:hypothetical protein T07_651 [Trichinella nelsoni]|uniref:Uncharacterized protein n=1 Tax=Trichinella nelsoni TaxID=6336 RepID=A0A0V0RQL3_9BILA|nr:hypothetical protein T07_651 [Trichinella nelsoni]
MFFLSLQFQENFSGWKIRIVTDFGEVVECGTNLRTVVGGGVSSSSSNISGDGRQIGLKTEAFVPQTGSNFAKYQLCKSRFNLIFGHLLTEKERLAAASESLLTAHGRSVDRLIEMSASIGVEKETDAQGRLKRHVDTKLSNTNPSSVELFLCFDITAWEQKNILVFEVMFETSIFGKHHASAAVLTEANKVMTFIHSSWNDIVERLECGKLEMISTPLPGSRSIQLNVCHQGKPYWRMQQGKKETNKLELINGLKHLFESSFFVACRSKGKRNATKPCVELLIRAIRLILPWHKHLSDEKEHHQIER